MRVGLGNTHIERGNWVSVLKMQPGNRVSDPNPVATLELSRLTSALSTINDAPLLQVPALLSQVAAAQTALAATQACLVARMLSTRDSAPLERGEGRWLGADEAAEILRVDRKWLYRRAKSLPFARRLSRKKLLFSEIGLRNWMSARRA